MILYFPHFRPSWKQVLRAKLPLDIASLWCLPSHYMFLECRNKIALPKCQPGSAFFICSNVLWKEAISFLF